MLGTFVALYKLLLNALPLFSFPQLADFSPPLLPWGSTTTPATPAGYDSDPNWSLMTPANENGRVVFELGGSGSKDEAEEVDPRNVKVRFVLG
jgi:hypothetical protein